MRIVVAGRVKDPFFHKAKLAAEAIASRSPQLEVEVHELFATDWEVFLETKTKEIGGSAIGFQHSPMIYEVTNEGKTKFIGSVEDFMEWCKNRYNYEEERPYQLFQALGKSTYKKKLEATKHTFCYFDFTQGTEAFGKVIFELYDDTCPKTCENFKRLCEGVEHDGKTYQYRDTPLHRVVPKGWIQGGDIFGGKGNKGGSKIYGPTFEDENFIVSHTYVGTLGMANKGEPHTNGSQFYITLSANMHWMDKEYVAFGKVIDGMKVLQTIAKLPTRNDRPTSEVTISNCGIYTP